MSFSQIFCPIAEMREISQGIFDMKLSSPELSAAARPGQFVSIKCDGFTLRRPISIASADPAENTVRIIFEVRGKGTDLLSEKKAGDVLDLLAPLGNGYPDLSDAKRIILVGGGIGTPPMLSVARKYPGKTYAFLGFRSAEKAILSDEFAALCKDVHIATEDGSLGEKGFITAPLSAFDFCKGDVICACGPTPLLKAVKKLSDERGVPAYISLEERMGCSTGACFGCVCRTVSGYRRVCRDGPVFNASEVIFDG